MNETIAIVNTKIFGVKVQSTGKLLVDMKKDCEAAKRTK
jgi:hypothetical protein